MATGYQKILTLIHKKNEKVVSEVSSHLTYRYNSVNSETTLKPQGFQPIRPEVSREQATTNSLSNEDPEWVGRMVELAITGRLTEPIPVSVKTNYQHILGEWVWFCPDHETANDKAPDLAFIPEELPVVIPLLIENRELAATLISAKQILGGTIMDSSLSGLEAGEPNSPQEDLDLQDPVEGESPDSADLQPLDNNASPHQEGGETQSTREGLPSPGRHLVIIRTVKACLHNYPDYTVPRARLEMNIIEGPESGKTLIDGISLFHPLETEGRRNRRLRIALRLGLISKEDFGKEVVTINWKSLEGTCCSVDVVHNTFKGRVFSMVNNYQLAQQQ